MKKGLIYSRVSTEEQAKEGQSIDAQIKLCTGYAAENDIQVVDIFKDEGKSGSNTNRPALQAMLERATNDEKIDCILVLDTDRLARNTLDHLSIKAILRKHEVSLISISQPMIDDSPEGRFIDVVLAGANALQSQLTGRKSSKVMEQKVKAGWWANVAPFGYINAINPKPTGTHDRRIIIPDPLRAPLITQLFEQYSTGAYTLKTVTEKMTAMGLIPKLSNKLHTSNIHNTLSNPLYYGKIPWKGQLYDGLHEPLTNKTTWDRCQEVLADHNQHATRIRQHFFLLRGFAYCADCQSRYWAAIHKKKYSHYYCKKCKGGTYVDSQSLENQVIAWFGKIEISKEYAEDLKSEAKKVLEDLRSLRSSDQKALVNQRTAIQSRIDGLEDKYMRDEIQSDRFNRMVGRLEEDLKAVDDELAKQQQDYSSGFESVMRLVKMAQNLKKSYKDATPGLKLHYLDLFFDKLLVKDGKIVEVLPSKSLKPLLKDGRIRVRVANNWLPVHELTRTLRESLISPIINYRWKGHYTIKLI